MANGINDNRVKLASELDTIDHRMRVNARRSAKWDAGAEELEREMAVARTKSHSFKPMGSWDTCERCGLARAEGPHPKE